MFSESCDVSSSVSIPKWLQNETVVVGASVACLKSVQVTGIDHYMLNISWTFVNFGMCNCTFIYMSYLYILIILVLNELQKPFVTYKKV